MKNTIGFMTHPRIGFISVIAVWVCVTTVAQAGESFPFVMPGFDCAATATDVSSLNKGPISTDEPVGIVNGHFVDGGGERLRLLGVNFSFGANFPEHADTDKLAPHLAKLGINAVRHHHMDARDIWRIRADGTPEVDPDKLEKLAYLIAQLAKHGIYSNINLHVSRSVTRVEGFHDADNLPRYNKYVLYLDERLKGLLKDYARTVLMYRNPHTDRCLGHEPSLVSVEITNENRFTLNGHEQVFSLPQRYQDEFSRRWNRYLQAKYTSTHALKAAWDINSEPLGRDIVDLGDFGGKTRSWSLSVRGDNQARLQFDTPGPSDDVKAVRVAIDRTDGVTHLLEFARGGLSVQADKLYTLSFWVRSVTPRPVYIDISQNSDPWQSVGMRETVQATPTWQHIVRPFRATKSLRAGARWIFKLGDHDGDVYLAAPRLRSGGSLMPFGKDNTLQAGTIPVPRTSLQKQAAMDLTAFMEETEKTFFAEMIRFLREDLGVAAPITGSQVQWQALSAFAPLDFVDAHAYWQHPSFPNQSWSQRNWTIPNTSMIASPGRDALSRLAWYRIWGRPYTVSEYNHPAPSDYQIECVPLLCAIAALQDWDGLYLYSYQHGNERWDENRIQSFFDINGNPAKLALLPTGAMIFRRQDVRAAQERVTARAGSSPNRGLALQHQVGTHLDAESALQGLSSSEAVSFETDTGEIRWDARAQEKARFTVDTPRTKLVLGFVAPGEISLNGLHLELGSASREFGLVALVSLDGKALDVSRRMLLTTMANASNRGMQWNEQRTSVSDRWGATPPMVEIVPAAVTIKRQRDNGSGQWKAYTLDATGQRQADVPLTAQGSSLRFNAHPSHRAVYYEIVQE
jgi:hypothetical protein